MITRKQYLEDKSPRAHQRYYAQFVTDEITNAVLEKIGSSAIKGSADRHFNDIPLRIWDSLVFPVNKSLLNETGEGFSLSTKVCIAKAAARIWLQKNVAYLHFGSPTGPFLTFSVKMIYPKVLFEGEWYEIQRDEESRFVVIEDEKVKVSLI